MRKNNYFRRNPVKQKKFLSSTGMSGNYGVRKKENRQTWDRQKSYKNKFSINVLRHMLYDERKDGQRESSSTTIKRSNHDPLIKSETRPNQSITIQRNRFELQPDQIAGLKVLRTDFT